MQQLSPAAAVQRQQAWIVGGAVPAYFADDRTDRNNRRCSYYGAGRCEPWVFPTICRWRTLAVHPGLCLAGLRRAADAGGARVGRRTHPVWPHRRLGAVLFAYYTNKKYVFKSSNESKKEFVSFVLLRLVTLLVETGCLSLLIDLLHIQPMISKIVVSFITIISNYVLCKFKVFKKEGVYCG